MTGAGGDDLTTTLTIETCGLCNADVARVITLGGQIWTLNANPTHDGIVIVEHTPDGRIRGRVLTGTDLPAQQPAHVDHHRTCTGRRRRASTSGPRCRRCQLGMDADLTRRENWIEHPCCEPDFLREVAAQQLPAITRAGAA